MAIDKAEWQYDTAKQGYCEKPATVPATIPSEVRAVPTPAPAVGIFRYHHESVPAALLLFLDLLCGEALEILLGKRLGHLHVFVETLIVYAVLEFLHGTVLARYPAGNCKYCECQCEYRSACHNPISFNFCIFAPSDTGVQILLFIY